MEPSGLVKLLVPQIPSLSYTALQHTFGATPTSSKWDLRTTLTVQVLRQIMGSGDAGKDGGGRKIPQVGKVQKRTLMEPGVKGKMWIVNAKMDASGAESVEEVVCKAVDDMKEGEVQYTKPGVEDVEVEWTGYRPNAAKDEPMPDISEEEKYQRMLAEPSRSSEVVWLYFHGGAYYLCDPRTHRALTSTLAKESNGVVCSVRYRLAPQTAFPGQLVDALLVYLSLLYPPPGSVHQAIPPENIVFAGDSAGGNLSFALLQLLLQLHRSSTGVPLVNFHGRDVYLPLPAGATANSGWFDISRSMPSITSNSKWDYLPPPNHADAVSKFPKDDVWPTDPPRGDLFCDLSLLDHPLASPVLAEKWEHSCPMWMCVGEEMLMDEDLIVAKRAASQNVNVTLERYEAMPHCFQLIFPHLSTAEKCVRNWGTWGRKVVEEPRALQAKGVFVPAKEGEETEFDVAQIEAVGFEEAGRLVREAKAKRLMGWEKEGKGMPKPAL
ncbi:related to lipase esterase [Lecanosticta acicola]|uniref:Related to lipase esterase n=1 Tax=Lecanosticta acicola TaxID=111012 RepID=A0AAI8YVD9_9PEZI|nr:related to lipase esterase [Lecanosticta acicola]